MKLKNKSWEVDTHIVLMPVCNGTIRKILNDRVNNRFTDIYVLDVGPDFHDPQATYGIIDKYMRSSQNILWVDHHFENWSAEAVIKYNASNNLVLRDTRSCAEIIKDMKFEKLSRNLVCFGTDADGIISAALLCAGNFLNDKQKYRLTDIAIKCDTASFYSDQLATNFHKAVYISRLNGTSIQLLELMVNLAKANFAKGKIYKELMAIVDKYDEVIAPANRKITSGQDVLLISDVNNTDVIVFNSDNVCNADLTYIFSRCYNYGYKIAIVENSTFIRVASNTYDLKSLFKLDHGMKYKIQLPKKDWKLNDVYEICRRRVNHYEI